MVQSTGVRLEQGNPSMLDEQQWLCNATVNTNQ